MGEFDVIRRFFDRPTNAVLLGNGDDCALIDVRDGVVLAVSTDMLVCGVHFFADADPHMLGWKALAVNLSDLAAMSAKPRAFTLALALPGIDEDWLAAFSDGLLQCADHYGCALVGGDTTRGPLTVSITVFGEVPPEQAPRRGDAILGDDIWVSGLLGAAAFALARQKERRAGLSEVSDNHDEQIDRALHQPAPRIELGLALRQKIHAMIDVSDGLAADLGHILNASGCGAALIESSLPIHPALASLPVAKRRQMALAGGDDYELCFTAAVHQRDAILKAAREAKTLVTRVGTVFEGVEFTLIDAEGAEAPIHEVLAQTGFDHFG